jgi:hypothetical protein
MLRVGMNVADKAPLFAEARRVSRARAWPARPWCGARLNTAPCRQRRDCYAGQDERFTGTDASRVLTGNYQPAPYCQPNLPSSAVGASDRQR